MRPSPDRRPLIALDFDGVVSDSAPESFVIALATYTESRGDSRFADRSWLAAPGRAPERDAIVGDPLYADFLRIMPLGNRAEDFGVALRALEAGHPLDDQPAYDRFRDRIDPDWLRAFHARFYAIRSELSDSDTPGWSALMGPYPDFIAMLRRRQRDAQLAIATAKDRRSVELLLREYGIVDLFPDDRIFDKETGVHKDSHLRALQAQLAVPYSEIWFIDDKLNHLEAVAVLGVRCGLAAWGYNGAREVEMARARGFAVLELDSVEAALFG